MPVKPVPANFKLKGFIAKTIGKKNNAAKQRWKPDHSCRVKCLIAGFPCRSPMLTHENWDKNSSSAAQLAYVDTSRPTASTAVVRLAPVRPHPRQIRHQPSPKGHNSGTKGHHRQELGFHSEEIEIVFRITGKCIHHEGRKGHKYGRHHKYFHGLRNSYLNLTGLTLQKVISTTIPLE